MFKFSKQIAAQLKSQIINQVSPLPKSTTQFQLSPRNISKRNSRLIRRMSSSIMGLVELCRVNSYCPPQIIEILQENHEHSKDDISKLQTFLSNSQIYSDLKESNIDPQLINKILIAFIPYLKLDKFPPNMCLCSYGCTPHKVYILLEGNVRIIKPISNDFYYNGFDYFSEIMKIQHAALYENNMKLNNDLLLEKTLTTNYHIFPINKDEINLLKFIVFREMYMKYIVKALPHSKDSGNSNNTNSGSSSRNNNNEQKELNILIDLFKQCYLSQRDFNIKYPHSIAYLPYIKSAISSELNQRLNDKVISKYTFINDTEKKRVQIYSYSSTYLNIEGDFIGETSCPNNNSSSILAFPKYSEYAISIAHSFCVSIPFDIFFQNINTEKEKIKTKEIGFLLQTHILRPIHFRKFKRAYFNNFVLKQYNKGDFIINDTDTLMGKVFIIKEGEIQITLKKSILSLIKIQKKLIALLKENECAWEKDVVYNEKEILNRKDRNKVYNYKLVCLGEKDVFGNGLVYYNVDNFYNVVVVSDKAKVYEVSKENFMKMAEGDVDVTKRFKLFGIRKIKNLLDRINNILSYVLYYGKGNERKREMEMVRDGNDNEGYNEVCNSNSSNNIIQMRFTKYTLNCNGGIGNAQMKTPKFSLTTNHITKKALCCNSPVRIGKSTTMKEYLSFTKNYHSSRNNYNVHNNKNDCCQNTNTITIESTLDNNHNNNNSKNNKNTASSKQYKSFKIKKQSKKHNNKTTCMNKYMYFEDKLLKYSKMLVQTSSFINDNSINKKYFESTLSNIGRCLSTDNNNNNTILNKFKLKTTHNKINITKNTKTSPYLTHTLSPTLTSSNEKGSTLDLKLPNITEIFSNTRHSLPLHHNNNHTHNTVNANNNEDDDCYTMEVNIQPKDCGIKGKKMGFSVNNIKVNKNIIYKKVIGNKLGY